MNELKRYKIGIMIPTTSRGRTWNNVKETHLYNIFLKSFLTTYDKEHTYTIYLATDDDDIVMNHGKAFLNRFVAVMNNVSLCFLSTKGIQKGHVTKMWNRLCEKAYNDGCDYMYQCGDDIEFLEKGWVNQSINMLKMNHNIGISGPYEVLQQRVLTQSFVSKKHWEIFGFFFPPEIINWHCDDWITYTYSDHFLPLFDVWCVNRGGTERYGIVNSKEKCVGLIKRDREVLKKRTRRIIFNKSNIHNIIAERKREMRKKDKTNIIKIRNNILKKKNING